MNLNTIQGRWNDVMIIQFKIFWAISTEHMIYSIDNK